MHLVTPSCTLQVTRYVGSGQLVGPNSVKVHGSDGKSEVIEAHNIVIATGSDSFELSGLKFDEKTVVSSTGALSFSKVPQKMVVIGGGIIGLELVCSCVASIRLIRTVGIRLVASGSRSHGD